MPSYLAKVSTMPCPACGGVTVCDEYVKPGSPRIGLICPRCGHVLEMEDIYQDGSGWYLGIELTGETI
jgi:hypothetical protein